MIKVPNLTKRKHTLRWMLLGYMFMLVVLLFLLFFIGILLLDGYSGTKQKVAETLHFQSEVFERQISSHYSSLAVAGIQLSERTAEYMDQYLSDNSLSFEKLKDSQVHITAIQDMLIEPLHQKLLETDCSGAFILLDTQINSDIENAATSRSGLYLQRNSLDSTDTGILLYRGLAEVGKEHDTMPHRKWRLEFDTSLFPNYDRLISSAALPLTESYRLTDVVTLPGTSERVMLLVVPIFGAQGRLYGLCGIEISESYFKHTFAQPSELEHAVFCLSSGRYGLTNARSSLTAGIVNDYYLLPSGDFCSKPFGSGLFTCESENFAYIGTIQVVSLCRGGDTFSISTLMPRQDYDSLAGKNSLRIVLLFVVIMAFAVVCCLYFSNRYLKPLKQSIDQIRRKEYANTESQLVEIEDLLAFLAEQEQKSEVAMATVQKERFSLQAELAQIQMEHEQDKRELQRLAYSRKTEVDPEDYEHFRRGIQDLTATERRVFNYYLEGRSVKEITELMGVKESTVRFHNRNIYMTLGVNSLKQLLRCAAILKQENESTASED